MAIFDLGRKKDEKEEVRDIFGEMFAKTKEKRASDSRQQVFQPSGTGAQVGTTRLSSPLDATPSLVNNKGEGAVITPKVPAPVNTTGRSFTDDILQQRKGISNSIQNKTSQPMMVDPRKRNELITNFTPKVDSPYQRQRAKDEWVEDRLEREREAVKDNKFLAGVNRLLEPVSRGIYTANANLPGVSAFQQGAGNVYGVKADTAPIEGNVADKIGNVAGMIAGSTMNFTNPSQGLISAPIKAGQGIAQSLASKSPILGNKFAQRSIEGAVAGGIQGGIISGARGETDAAEMAKNIGMGIGLGALGDVALTGLGSGIKSLGKVADNAASDLMSNKLTAVNAIESAVQSTPNNPNTTLPSSVQRPNASSIKETPNLNEPWFEKLFGRGGVGIAAGRGNGKNLIDTQITKNATKQAPMIERFKDSTTAINQDYIDRFAPLHNISKESYDSAMDSTKSNNLANIAVKDKFVDLDGKVIGGSLKDNYSTVPRTGNNLADTYVIMRDAIDRMKRGIQVYDPKNKAAPKTWEEAASMVGKMERENPWLMEFGEDWNKFTANSRKLAVDSGLMSQRMSDALEESNPNYARMQRQMSNVKSNAFRNTKDSLSGQGHGVKRLKGGTQKIVDPAQSRINATSNLYNSALRNRAMQKIYDAVAADPESFKDIIEIVPFETRTKNTVIDKINKVIEEDGLDGLTKFLNDEADTLFTKSKNQSARASDNHVTVMIDGDPHKLNVKELGLLRAVEGITPESLSGVLKAVDYLSRGVKISATGALAPVQGLKLFARDIPMAFAQSKDKLHFMQDISHALITQVADWLPDFVPGAKNMSKLAREYYRAGGGYEQHLKGDSRIRATAADIKNNPILSMANLKKQTRATGLGFRPLKEMGDAFENIPRIAAFQAAMRKNGWKRDEATIREALRDAREATVNWSRKGGKGQQIETLLPYSNAAVQGTYRMAKFMKEQPVSAMAFVMGVAGASIGAYEKFKDDPDYKHRSKFAQGIPVHKTKDGKFVTIPTEPAYQYIADQILNFYKWAKDNEDLPNAGESIQEGLDAFTPKYISGPSSLLTTPKEDNRVQTATSKTLGGSSLEPLVAASTGKNYFGGDIVPREYQGRSISEQKDATTSAPANWAAENLGMDAFTFDYIAEKFGGDLAKVLLPMTSDVGKGDPMGDIVDQTLARLKVLEDPVMSNNLSNEYYKYIDTVKRIEADGKEPPAWYKPVYDNITSTKKGSIASGISDLNKYKKELQRSLTLTAKQRSDQIRSVQTEINLLRIKGIEIMEKAGVRD